MASNDTLTIDPHRTYRAVEERLAAETNPKRRRNLAMLLTHLKAETRGDIDALVATVTDQSAYVCNYLPVPKSYHGKAGIRQYYNELFSMGSIRDEFDIRTLVVDDDCIVTEGRHRSAIRGEWLRQQGINVPDPGACYLSEMEALVVWPFDAEGYILGEILYASPNALTGIENRKLDPAEIGAI